MVRNLPSLYHFLIVVLNSSRRIIWRYIPPLSITSKILPQTSTYLPSSSRPFSDDLLYSHPILVVVPSRCAHYSTWKCWEYAVYSTFEHTCCERIIFVQWGGRSVAHLDGILRAFSFVQGICEREVWMRRWDLHVVVRNNGGSDEFWPCTLTYQSFDWDIAPEEQNCKALLRFSKDSIMSHIASYEDAIIFLGKQSFCQRSRSIADLCLESHQNPSSCTPLKLISKKTPSKTNPPTIVLPS